MNDSTGPAGDTPDDSSLPLEEPDTFALAPQERTPRFEPPLPVPPVDINEPPDIPEDRQFSLRELLGLVAIVSVVLSAVSTIARYMGWTDSPARLASVLAVVFGAGTLIGLVLSAFASNVRPIARVGLWVMLAGYFLCAACAALLPK